jgi:protein-L-isoaspartate(D-aspartate) O-methyltransferase
MNYTQTRDNMVESQLRTNKIVDARLIAAFASVEREQFLPLELQPIAYVDEEISLANGRFLLEPMVFARLIQAAAIKQTDKVLVLGAGCGYGAAIIATLTPDVVAVETDKAVLKNPEKLAGITVVIGALEEGCAAHAPYDVIIIEGSVSEIPAAISAQLADGGRLVTIVRDDVYTTGQAVLLLKQANALSQTRLFDASTPYLTGFSPKLVFKF